MDFLIIIGELKGFSQIIIKEKIFNADYDLSMIIYLKYDK